MDRYAVLVFHGQPIDDDQHLAFTRSLGDLEHAIGTSLRGPQELRLPTTFADVSNLDKDNASFARDDRRRLFAIGNRLWHSDSSFKAVPAKYSLLHARSIPSKGGNTEFAVHARRLRRAGRGDESLDRGPRLRALADLLAPAARLHRLHRRGARALQARAPAPRAHPSDHGPEVALPVVHAGGIVGWPVPEARAFLSDLTEHATQREFVYAHKWRVGDLVMWDNRQTMHRARPFPVDEPRDMRRTTLVGDGMTVPQAV